jgi:hypothetical protein
MNPSKIPPNDLERWENEGGALASLKLDKRVVPPPARSFARTAGMLHLPHAALDRA